MQLEDIGGLKELAHRRVEVAREDLDTFSKELGRRISKAEIIRHESDYNEFYLVTKEETLQQVETAELLLQAVEKYLERQ